MRTNRLFGCSPDWQAFPSAHWREKAAATNDNTSFEQAFANLAHSTLRDSAAKLLDYEVGFQLIEKNKDNTRAVGVFGFQLSGQWLYAPVFFLNGELKGHELLYVKSQALFTPLSDDWVNYLLGHKPPMLGKEVSRNQADLGIRSPDLQRLIRSPGKIASALPDIPDWLTGFIEDLPTLALEKVASVSPWALPDAIKEMGREAAVYLRDVVGRAYPQVTAGFEHFYGQGSLQKLAEAPAVRGLDLLSQTRRPLVGSILKQGSGGNVGSKITVITRHDVLDNSGEIPADKERRLEAVEKGISVDDRRDGKETAKVYRENHPLNVYHPIETGIYTVFLYPDKLVDHLVVVNPISEDRRQPHALVMNIETGAWGITSATQLVCSSRWSDEKYREWFDRQPEVTPSRMKGPAFLLDESGSGTAVFTAENTFGGSGDCGSASTIHWIRDYRFHGEAGYDQTPDAASPSNRPSKSPDRGSPVREIVLRPQVATIDILGGSVYVPQGARCISVAKEQTEIPYGTTKDMLAAMAGDDSWLNVHSHEFGVSIADKDYRDKNAALRHLIVDWNLREAAAREVLKEAASQPHRVVKFRVKAAESELVREAPSANVIHDTPTQNDAFMNTGMPTEYPYARSQRIPDLAASTYGPPPKLPDPDTLSEAQQAASKGEKQLFDTKVFQTMLGANRFDTIIGRRLGDLIKGMHGKGCIYFQFLWHGDAFKDRYGAEELPNIEDGLRTAFEADGKLVLALKQRSIEPSAVDGIRHDLGTINQ